MTRSEAMIHRLRTGLPASARVVIVTAHPDDESLGLGGVLSLLQDATVLQLTTAAAAGDDATAAMRSAERDAAWQAAGWSVPIVEGGVPDQQVHAFLAPLLDTLMLRLAGADVVWTHPYEGGHPDHDGAAFLVQTACDRLGTQAPDRWEFASYHWNGQNRVAGDFFPHADPTVMRVRLTGERLEQKRRAIAAYTSQAFIQRWFDPSVECYRPAPRYDFARAPQTPGCLYERKGWPLTQAAWRAATQRVA